ncbi:MAG: DUF2490 domain-containing protein [Bacteroidetes bacterium]|nr:DUF2490 domain-containing protein [Bacteroidota bacterium]
MRKVIPAVFLFLCLLFPQKGIFAQVNDAQLWTSLNIEKKITPVLSAHFTEEVRLNENITEVGTIFSDFSLSYRLGKRFKIAAGYRFSNQRNVDDSYDKRHRYYFDLGYREKVKPVTFLLRTRFQSEYSNIYSSEDGFVPDNHARVKLTLKFDLNRKFVPYIEGESFFRLNRIVYGSFDQLRLCGGIEYTFNRMHMVDVHYLFRKEYNVKHPETDYVVGISYYFTF